MLTIKLKTGLDHQCLVAFNNEKFYNSLSLFLNKNNLKRWYSKNIKDIFLIVLSSMINVMQRKINMFKNKEM